MVATAKGAKARSYVRIMCGLWGTAALVTIVVPVRELFVAPPVSRGWLSPSAAEGLAEPAVVVALVLGVAIALAVPVVLAAVHGPTRERLRQSVALFQHLIPDTHAERALMAGVALTAGCTEELIYRGFLLRYFAGWGLPLAGTVALSAAVFGVAHAGQGWKGMVATGFAGVFFAGLYLATGSLLLPMVIHAMIDLRILAIGLVLRRRGPTVAG